MKTQLKKLPTATTLSALALCAWMGATPKAMAAAPEELAAQPDVSVESAPNGDQFTLRVDNRSDRDLTLTIDLHCTRGPDYRQGVDRHSTREFTYSTYSGGSCFFERSTVRIGLEGITRTEFHWESGFVPAGWRRGEADGPLPHGLQFFSSQDGFSSLIYAP